MKMIFCFIIALSTLSACQSEQPATASAQSTPAHAATASQTNGAATADAKKSQAKNGWEVDRLRGKVQRITDQRYYATQEKGGVKKGKKVQEETDQTTVYDLNGNVLSNTRYDYNKKTTIRKTYQYNDAGQVAETREVELKKGFTTTEKLIALYKLQYDAAGNNNLIEWYMEKDSLREKQIGTFDKAGNKIGELRQTPDGKAIGRSVFDYDRDGKIIEVNNYAATEKLFNQGMFTYDSKGNKTEERWEYPDSKVTVIRKMTYDANGNIATIDSKIEGPKPKGNAMQQFSYEYDAEGNWIKQILTLEGNVQGITERTIEYFDDHKK